MAARRSASLGILPRALDGWVELGEVGAELGVIESFGVSSLRRKPIGAERSVGFFAVTRKKIPGHALFRAPGDAGERVGVVGEHGNGVAAPGAGRGVVGGEFAGAQARDGAMAAQKNAREKRGRVPD